MLTWQEEEKKFLVNNFPTVCVLEYVMHVRTLAFNLTSLICPLKCFLSTTTVLANKFDMYFTLNSVTHAHLVTF